MVKSYNDAVKQKSREKLGCFVKKNLLSRMSPRDVKVVCFPGAEAIGQEALEIKEVYDRLGIPRENIVGIEYNHDNAERLRRADLGIRVVEGDALDFFKRTSSEFDVISLDYTGQRTWRERDVTRYVAGRGLLGSGGVFCTNHLAKREGVKMKEDLFDMMASQDYVQSLISAVSSRGADEFGHDLESVTRCICKKVEEGRYSLEEKTFDLNVLREQIVRDNIATLGGGTLEISPHKNYFSNNRCYTEHLNNCKRISNAKSLPGGNGLDVEIEDYIIHKTIFQDFFLAVSGQLSEKVGIPGDLSVRILQSFIMNENMAYSPRKVERYSYTSNKNANMLLDMIHAERLPRVIVNSARRIIGPSMGNMGLKYNPHNLNPKDLNKVVSKFKKFPSSWFAVNMPDSVYLGSSWVSPKRKRKLSKENAIKFMKEGRTPVELESEFSGFTKGQLSAIKAHITMGTY